MHGPCRNAQDGKPGPRGACRYRFSLFLRLVPHTRLHTWQHFVCNRLSCDSPARREGARAGPGSVHSLTTVFTHRPGQSHDLRRRK